MSDQRGMTLLEADFPYATVSALVLADRRSRDPAYQSHKWWARRPPALVRGALVAAALPANASNVEFDAAYASAEPLLAGLTVLDPFAGGGTTLVEATRLGARAYGQDVDPLAVLLGAHQLDSAPSHEVTAAGRALLTHLQEALGHLWLAPEDGWEPLHYFTVARVTCPSCATNGLLYRNLLLARSTGKAGSVIRDDAVTVFCPNCLNPKATRAGAKTFACCGRRNLIDRGTYSKGRYTCQACGTRSDHEQLQTGTAPRALVAVEETPTPGSSTTRRRLRPAREADLIGETIAVSLLAADDIVRDVLGRSLASAPNDRRPVSYGIKRIEQLHTARQSAYLAAAHAWLNTAPLDPRVERALRLAVSSTVASNNKLCGYATDYGRLAPLFSVRAFSLPSLAVELNPLNDAGGRGTLAAAVRRAARSAETSVRRHVPGPAGPRAQTLTLPRSNPGSSVLNADSSGMSQSLPDGNLCLTDPPYYDFIPYDALSQVFRAWLPEHDLAGEPVLPVGSDPVGDFGARLGKAFKTTRRALRPGSLLAFTYKGGADAWDAIAIALDAAKLMVTALWPVLADPHMGHHADAGNCEYDVIVVTRRAEDTSPSKPRADSQSWLTVLGDVSAADHANFKHANRIAHPRWGRP